MNKLIYRLPLQYFAEEVASADDVDFGAAFASDSEGSGESEPQETSVETTGENVEKVEVADQQTEAEEIPNEVWKKARLKAEREYNDKLKSMEEKFNNNFASDDYIGKVDPYTNKVIRTKADEQAYLDAFSRDTLKANGLDENMIQNMIDNNPVIQEAKMLKQQIQQERGQAQLQKEIEMIAELNPNIKTLEDFRKLPNIEELDNMIINRGMSLSEAYKLANFKELTERQSAVAKQQAINLAKGKSHLTSTEGNAGEEITVPKDVLELYKALNPEMSTADIRADYAKRHK